MEQIIYQEKYDETPATSAVESFIKLFLGITVSKVKINVAQYQSFYFPRYIPVRYATLIDSDKGVAIQGLHWQGQKIIFDPMLPAGNYDLNYASGYGVLKGTLPATLDTRFTTALESSNELPADIQMAISRLQLVFDDRVLDREDVSSHSGSLALTTYVVGTDKMAIPYSIKGLLLNYRRKFI